ncbi:MAG: hypothetical protein R6V77_06220, partial [Candidatus Cloacimonadaceae bacterium]
MRRFVLLTILLFAFCLLSAQDLTPWQYVRHSAVDNNGVVHVRFNGNPSILNEYELYNWQNSAWTEMPLTTPETFVYEALLPAVTGQTLKYRLRTHYDYMGESITAVNPAFLSGDPWPVTVNTLGHIADDPAGDSINVYHPNLDILGNWFGYSDNKLYCAMSNASYLFPTMNSFTSYNMYFAGLASTTTAVADSSVYAMIHTFNIPGVISPGLYKLGINLADTTVIYQYLGPIQSVVSSGKLFLSCNISDLTADPEFGNWPPDYNSLGFMSGSMRIDIDLGTLTPSFGIGDLSGIAQLVFENHQYAIGQNTLPQIINPQMSGVIGNVTVSFDYFDANQDFPLYAKIIMTGTGSEVDFIPTSLDFTQPVHMVAIEPVGEEWSSVLIKISDNNIDFVEYFIDVSNEDEIQPPATAVKIYPNPFNPAKGVLHFKHPAYVTYPDRRIWIYNPRGQLVKLIDMEANIHWDGRDNSGKPVGDGIYFLMHFDYEDMKGYKVNKILVI